MYGLPKKFVCCVCDPSVHLIVHSICFVYVFCMSGVISSFKSLRAGSQVFALRMLFPCVIVHNMWSVRECNCSASCPLVCCACLPSVGCL